MPAFDDCSPRTRGWSHGAGGRRRRSRLLPAHAGMVPMAAPWSSTTPACSPRTRGWSPAGLAEGRRVRLLPAHAGMVPRYSRNTACRTSAPRARGDGPCRPSPSTGASTCSPRTRGWSHGAGGRRRAGHLLPAHAGMVPAARHRRPGPAPAPRARGDGPVSHMPSALTAVCSPRAGVAPAGRGECVQVSPARVQARTDRLWSQARRCWSALHVRCVQIFGVLPARGRCSPL